MDDELTPEQRFAAEDAETIVPRALLAGRAPADIIAELIKLDWSPVAARAFVEGMIAEMREFRESPESRQRLMDSAFRRSVGGFLVALVGIGIGAITFLLMLRGSVMLAGYGLAFVVFFGGLLSGGRAWSRWRTYRTWKSKLVRDK